jgi:sulfotransferase family protein
VITNPYVFIVGCPRSGTTLLRRIVNAHPQIAIPARETHWIPRMLENPRGVTREGTVTPELIPMLLDEPHFARLGFGREQLEGLMGQGEPISYSAFVTGVFDLHGKAKGKPLVGDKTPSYVRRIKTLHGLWPAARFVHLIRDGRDVCLSWMNWSKAEKNLGKLTTGKEDPVSTVAVKWELDVWCGQQAGRRLVPGLYYEIRYESLVAQPREECAALCGFLGVPYDDGMLRFYQGRTRPAAGHGSKHAWLPITPGLRDWTTQMAAEDVERFEAAAGQLLDELGYPRAVPHPRPESLEHTSRIREQLVRDPRWIEYSRARSEIERHVA